MRIDKAIQKQNKYKEELSILVIPKTIIKNKKIPPSAKLILGMILTKKNCSVQNLISEIGYSVSEIYYLLSILKHVGINVINGVIFPPKKLSYISEHSDALEKSVYNTIRLTYEVSKDCSIKKLNSNSQSRSDCIPTFPNSNTPVPSSTPSLTLGQRVRQHIRDNRPAKPKIKLVPDPLLEKIMAMPNLPKHRQGTKVYTYTSDMLKSLQGDLFQTVPLDKSWAEHFGITLAILKTRWPAFQILATFQAVARAYTKGYHPEDKSVLPKSITDIVYNPRSRKSLFLKAYTHGNPPASRLSETAREKKLSPRESQALSIFKAAITSVKGEELTQDENIWVSQITKNTIEEFDAHVQATGAWDCLTNFVEDYVGWIRDEHSGRLQTIRWLGPGTSDWRKYYKSRGLDEMVRAKGRD